MFKELRLLIKDLNFVVDDVLCWVVDDGWRRVFNFDFVGDFGLVLSDDNLVFELRNRGLNPDFVFVVDDWLGNSTQYFRD